jgi:hypothetical protein
LPRHFHAGDFAGGQLLLNGSVEVLRGKTEAVNERNPVIQDVPFFILEPENKIDAITKELTFFELVIF